jgi:hypothetical protein
MRDLDTIDSGFGSWLQCAGRSASMAASLSSRHVDELFDERNELFGS